MSSNNINPASINAGVKVEKTGTAGQAAGIGAKGSLELDGLLADAGKSTASGQLKTSAFDFVKALVG